MSNTCRWCNLQLEAKDPLVLSYNDRCKFCDSSQSAALTIKDNYGENSIVFYHNPDNSIFIEFMAKEGRSSRYTLSEDLLLKSGALALFPTPTDGKRNP